MRPTAATMPPPTSVVEATTELLTRVLGDDLVAAFLYGSVARGTASAGSDIDCFALLGAAVPTRRRRAATDAFAVLQARFGYVPDHDYPLEVFTVTACADALASPVVADALGRAGAGVHVPRAVIDSDQLEVLRALVDAHVVLIDHPSLTGLVTDAERLLARHLGTLHVQTAARARRMLGIRTGIATR